MLAEGLNIFTDYVHNDVAIFEAQKAVEQNENAVAKIENGFGEEVIIADLMDYNRAISALNQTKSVLENLTQEKERLAGEIKGFFGRFPRTKRISFKGRPPFEGKEWFVIDLYNNQVRIQSVKA